MGGYILNTLTQKIFKKKIKKKFKKFLPHKKTPKENKKGLKEVAKV